MRRRMICLFLVILMIPAFAAGEGKVFTPETTEPFSGDAELLTIYVATILGGDCMLITLGDKSMFVDLGTDQNINEINAVIEKAGIDRVDYFFNTHPHRDHVGGFMPLVDQGFEIGTMFTFFPHDYYGNAVMQIRAMRYAEAAGIPVVDLKTEDTVPFGDAQLTAYRLPDERIGPEKTCNDLSAMLMVRYGECSALLTADVEYTQPTLAELYDLKADILKFPHHGLTAMASAFLDEISPEFVFITHGTYDTARGQEQLKNRGYQRVAFATLGMIIMQTDGTKWIIRQEILPERQAFYEKYMKKNSWIQPLEELN